MSSLATLVLQVKELRARAARFYRADFHLHSPFSKDWMNDSADSNLSRNTKHPISEETIKAYYDAVKNSGVQFAAITDHMRWSFGAECAKHSMAKKDLDRLVFLPGIELTVEFDIPTISGYKVHVLAIFSETASSQIERIFSGLPGLSVPGESERTGNECLSFKDIGQLVKAIKSNGGLAIAAHVDSSNGARLMFTANAKLLLEPLEGKEPAHFKEAYAKVGNEVKKVLCEFDALQVRSAKESVHYLNDEKELIIPLVLSTDAHDTSNLGRKNSLTWIKMAVPTFDCLQKAFCFPDTRIRFLSNLPDCKPPRLLGLRIVGAQKGPKTFFDTLTLGFSDNLTTIVGPRGSGKSAVIDAIRYVFGYNRSLDEIGKLKDQILERQKHTLAQSRIEIVYETKDGNVRILSSTYDSNEDYTTKVYDPEGKELSVEDVEQCGDFPLNLYGWNELELLGERPSSQRESLDKFIHSIKALKSDRRDLYKALERNRLECISKANGLDQFFKEERDRASILRIPEYQEEFNRLNTPEIRGKFEELDLRSAKINIARDLKNKLENFKKDLDKLAISDTKSILDNVKESAAFTWAEVYLKEELKWDTLREALREKRIELSSVEQILEERLRELCLDLDAEHREIEAQIRSELGTQSAISAELRNNAKARLDKALGEYSRYGQAYSAFEELLNQRQNLTDQLKATNQQIFATRDAHKTAIIESIMVVQDDKFKINLVLNQGNDRENLIEFLSDSQYKPDYVGKQYKANEMPTIIANQHDPLSLYDVFVKNISGGLVGSLTSLGSGGVLKPKSIDGTTSQAIVQANHPFGKIDSPPLTRVFPKKLDTALRMQEVQFDDEFYIELNGRPIQQCSPGQRCSAMLPIVTLTSEAPIIIDQPEDNLDNRLVSKAIFKILSKLKETRQIIVATHNPNIPVSGDAELVNVLEAEGHIKTTGSIDDDSVVRDIIDLLEGGKEAFEKRQRRYQKFVTPMKS